MSNRRRAKATTPPTRGEWLKCEDCNSSVYEVWHDQGLCIEVAHSPTCPYWARAKREEPHCPEHDREVAIQFLPQSEGAE